VAGAASRVRGVGRNGGRTSRCQPQKPPVARGGPSSRDEYANARYRTHPARSTQRLFAEQVLAPRPRWTLWQGPRPPRGDSIEDALVEGQPGLSGPVCVHYVDLLVAIAGALERNLLPVGRPPPPPLAPPPPLPPPP